MRSVMSVKKTMGATRREFFRSLTHFAPDNNRDENKSEFVLAHGGGNVTIRLRDMEPKRVTGLLSMPQLEVTLDFDGLSANEIDEFMADFDLSFRRGGG